MLHEEQHLDRTPDLVSKVRKLREEAEKKMNRFTRADDYDVRYVQGHGSKHAQSAEGAIAAGLSAIQDSVTDASATVAEDQAGEES